MALEEEFNISVNESGAESISTVQDAADLIEKSIEKSWKEKTLNSLWSHQIEESKVVVVDFVNISQF